MAREVRPSSELADLSGSRGYTGAHAVRERSVTRTRAFSYNLYDNIFTCCFRARAINNNNMKIHIKLFGEHFNSIFSFSLKTERGKIADDNFSGCRTCR